MSSCNLIYNTNTATSLSSFYTINTNGSPGYGSMAGSCGTFWTTTSSPYTFTTNGQSQGLHVKGNAEFEGDVTIQGHSILHVMQKIENRLAILQEPDPEKLEKFAALKKAYDHYVLMEKLIGD